MEVQSWDLHCCILCKMVVDRGFEGGAWLGGKNAISWMEKDEDLQGMIQSTHCVYAQQLKMAWDVKNWDRESSKTSWTKQLVDVLDFHEFKMIHGR